jgi:hypothetical protein
VDERECNRCNVIKPLEEFSKHPKGKLGRHPTCRACKNLEAKAHYAVNKDAILERQKPRKRAADRRRKYGLSDGEYAAMVSAQNGLCALGHETDGYLMVDHDHETGAVRGLLCRACNWALGFMRDEPERLRIAADYLERAAAARP